MAYYSCGHKVCEVCGSVIGDIRDTTRKDIRRLKMYWIYLTGRKTKIGYGFDYCEDIHTERCKNDIKLVFTSRRERVECSLKDFDFRIEKEQEDEE